MNQNRIQTTVLYSDCPLYSLWSEYRASASVIHLHLNIGHENVCYSEQTSFNILYNSGSKTKIGKPNAIQLPNLLKVGKPMATILFGFHGLDHFINKENNIILINGLCKKVVFEWLGSQMERHQPTQIGFEPPLYSDPACKVIQLCNQEPNLESIPVLNCCYFLFLLRIMLKDKDKIQLEKTLHRKKMSRLIR